MNLWVPVVKVSFKKFQIGNRAKPSKIKPSPYKTKTSSRRRFAIPLLILFFGAGLIFLIVHHLTAPAEGTISQTPAANAEVSDPYSQKGQYRGKYVSFSYPPHYKPGTAQLTGGYLDVASFNSTDLSGKHISVGIKNGSVTSDSGVVYRRQHPVIYTAQPQTRYGLIFTSSANGSEQTAFSQHDAYYATISVTSNNNIDLGNDSQAILTSLKWNQ